MEQTLNAVIRKQPKWFDGNTARLLGDLSYDVLYGKKTGERFLVRKTNAWTDMFDGVKKPHWRVNSIQDDLKIGDLHDEIFKTLEDVKTYLLDK